MKPKTKFLTTVLLGLFTVSVFSQSRRVADRYFEEFAYLKAAKIYEAVYDKGDTTKYLLKRLGDSYYNNSLTAEAELWYEKLIREKQEKDPEYLFKYAQVLRSNGRSQEADSIFVVLNKDLKAEAQEKYVNEDNFLQDFLNEGNKKISLRNLAINTPLSDFGGVIFNDKVYFASAASSLETRKQKLYKWNNQPFLNIYSSDGYFEKLEGIQRDTVFELANKEKLVGPVNTQYHESSPVFTKDGKYMYFSRVNYNGKKLKKDKSATVNLKLFRAENLNGNWGNIEELPFNSDEYSVSHPALSPDDKVLYFASDMPGSIGKTDIFKVTVNEDSFGDPVNLGNQVNTEEKEMFPFVSEDNVLFFSSNGHRGMGLLDIFQTKIFDDGTYSEIVNLEYPFNSKKDDFAFYVDFTGKKGFFSSNRSKGKGDDDIYSFYISELPEAEKCYQYIKGVVTNKVTKEPIPYTSVKLINEDKDILEEVLTDEEGIYRFTKLECGTANFIVTTEHMDYRGADRKKVSTKLKEEEKKYVVDLELDPLIIGNQIVIKPIYFDYDKSFIREDAQYELENIVTVMDNHPNMIIKIESHTDSRGAKDYNRKLSDRRAKSTRDFIISRGIKADRIESAIGYGEDHLLNHCNDANRKKCSEEEHQLNRRSYFYIVSGKNEVVVENAKPSVVDDQGYDDQKKVLLERLRRIRKIRKPKGNLRSLRQDNKCYKSDSDCSSF